MHILLGLEASLTIKISLGLQAALKLAASQRLAMARQTVVDQFQALRCQEQGQLGLG